MILTDTEAIVLQVALVVMVLLAYALGVATSIYIITRSEVSHENDLQGRAR